MSSLSQDSVDADSMLKQLRGYPLLSGWRNRPARDVQAVRDVLLRFSHLIETVPEISQAEINPLMVFDEGQGVLAVDVRIFVAPVPEE